MEDPGVDGRIILRWIFRKWDGSMDWIDVAQDRDRWQALVNAAMNIWVPIKCREFLDCLTEPVSFSRRTLLHGISTYLRQIWPFFKKELIVWESEFLIVFLLKIWIFQIILRNFKSH